MSDHRTEKESKRIPNGYILKARCIEDSAIAHAPPHVRDIWDYLLRKAFWKDGKYLKRGELSTSYREIQEDLHWKIGWRKEQFTDSQCENAMKYLKKAGMIATRRTTHGFIISVCNYCRFQDPENYESHSERYRNATGEPQPPDTTDEEGYKQKKKEKNIPPKSPKGDLSSVILKANLSPDRAASLDLWLQHKKEIGKSYKSTGLKSLIKKWADKSDAEFRAAVESSSSNGYEGLFEPKNNGRDLLPSEKSYPNCPAGMVPYEFGGKFKRPGNAADEAAFRKAVC